MSSPLKCPNPACTFLFDPSTVPPGAVIACPRCALRFTLGPAAPSYPTDPGYGYGPPPATPEPTSAFEGNPFAESEERQDRPSEEGDDDRPRGRRDGAGASTGGDVLKKAKGNRGALLSILVAAGIVSGIAGLAALAFILYRTNENNRRVEETSTELKYADFNLQFKKPSAESGWTQHDATRTGFNAALFGYQRGDEASPTAWIVGDAKKYTYAVRPTDLRDRMMERLNENFDNVSESEDPRDDSLCGLPATRFQFRATHKKSGDSVVMEVCALASKTVGVWIFSWSPEREFTGQAEAFKGVRAGLQLAKLNDTATEAVTATKTHRSKSGLFTLKDSDGLWAKKEPATDRDAAGTLWLRGTPKSQGGKNRPSPVDLVVVEVEPGGDAKEQALEIVKKSLPEGGPIIEELTGDPTGDAASGDLEPATPVTRLKVRYKGADAGVNRLVVFSAVESGGKRIVAYVECQLKDLPYWEQRLMQIIGSLTPHAK